MLGLRPGAEVLCRSNKGLLRIRQEGRGLGKLGPLGDFGKAVLFRTLDGLVGSGGTRGGLAYRRVLLEGARRRNLDRLRLDKLIVGEGVLLFVRDVVEKAVLVVLRVLVVLGNLMVVLDESRRLG